VGEEPAPATKFDRIVMWYLKKETNEPYAYFPDVFKKEAIDKLIEHTLSIGLDKGVVGGNESKERLEIRNSNVKFLPMDEFYIPYYQTCTDAISSLNRDFFQYDLTYMEHIQFTQYKGEENGHYGSHVDLDYSAVPAMYRKLSFSLLLADPTTYEGGDLLLYPWDLGSPLVAPRVQGMMVAFPSYMIHEVKPVTKGTRHSLVSWVMGPKFK
jgi:PKHD-type hydroxylase